MDTSGGEPTIDRSAISELTTSLSETARIMFEAGGVHDTLAQLAESAVETIEGCDSASLFLVDDGVVTSGYHTDPLAQTADELQHRAGEGPCVDAVTHNLVLYADDLAQDVRWPAFGPLAVEHGLRSVLALPVMAERTLGSLNIYAQYPSAFGVVDRGRGVFLASLASLAVSAARSHEDDARRVDNLHRALKTREVIGQAQGILMERERISAEQAFSILRKASQHLNVKLRDVAQDLVETGEGPNTGPV